MMGHAPFQQDLSLMHRPAAVGVSWPLLTTAARLSLGLDGVPILYGYARPHRPFGCPAEGKVSGESDTERQALEMTQPVVVVESGEVCGSSGDFSTLAKRSPHAKGPPSTDGPWTRVLTRWQEEESSRAESSQLNRRVWGSKVCPNKVVFAKAEEGERCALPHPRNGISLPAEGSE